MNAVDNKKEYEKDKLIIKRLLIAKGEYYGKVGYQYVSIVLDKILGVKK